MGNYGRAIEHSPQNLNIQDQLDVVEADFRDRSCATAARNVDMDVGSAPAASYQISPTQDRAPLRVLYWSLQNV